MEPITDTEKIEEAQTELMARTDFEFGILLQQIVVAVSHAETSLAQV